MSMIRLMDDSRSDTHEMIVFPDPAKMLETVSSRKDGKGRDARRPFTHKSEPVDFHCPNVSPCVNQVAVPL